MKRLIAVLIALTLIPPATVLAHDWKMQPVEPQTRWSASVSPDNALPEYPRPQLVRAHWRNLNGLWSYAITPNDTTRPTHYDGTILVPYPVESALSGVRKPLRPDQLLWYRRTITLDPPAAGRRELLHFDAVDYRATVFVNGREIGTHSGGYQRFTLDITDALKPGDNELLVKVFDPTDTGPNPRGKQTLQPQDIYYTSSSGIWRTVWLEEVPETYIESVITTPRVQPDRSELLLSVHVKGSASGYTIQATARIGHKVVAAQTVQGTAALAIPDPHWWSPDDPFLYDLEVRLLKDDQVIDQIRSYFGLRSIEIKKDPAGVARIFLNGRFTYNLGVLDQGFWPDGLYTAPTDTALKFDIQAIKAMGFNTIRKHVKIEPDRWYYYCDKLGLMVWQDMVPPGNDTPEARAQFEAEVQENLAQLHNHPSITTWVLFNEGWGAYDQGRLARWVKALDPGRLVNAHSGPNLVHMAEWERQLAPATLSKLLNGDQGPIFQELSQNGFNDRLNWVGSEMADVHVYPGPGMPPGQTERALALGEHGGLFVPIEGHLWNGLAGSGYLRTSQATATATYSAMVDQLKAFAARGLSASIYTQPFDVEVEQNGLITYDRAVIKIPLADMARINATLVPRAGNYIPATRGFCVENADLTSGSRRYAKWVAEYQKGNRDPGFLRHLALRAVGEKDQQQATLAGNDYISRLPQPYSKDAWTFIQAVTRTSRDKGFELLRTRAAEADAALGDNAAEKTFRDVIGHEEIEPHLAETTHAPQWAAIEKSVIDQYGVLGAEKVYGTEMIQALERQDWPNFGKYYASYFATAANRPEYSITDLSYAIFHHIDDDGVLQAAVNACRIALQASDLDGATTPEDIDTYANLLYKVGRGREAVEWEEKATALSQGHNQVIPDHLDKMRAGEPTWPLQQASPYASSSGP